jgi:hypothetical protein
MTTTPMAEFVVENRAFAEQQIDQAELKANSVKLNGLFVEMAEITARSNEDKPLDGDSDRMKFIIAEAQRLTDRNMIIWAKYVTVGSPGE